MPCDTWIVERVGRAARTGCNAPFCEGGTMTEITIPAARLRNVSCDYCGTAIPAMAFHFVRDSTRLVAAVCGGCGRALTMSAATWHRRTGAPVPQYVAASP